MEGSAIVGPLRRRADFLALILPNLVALIGECGQVLDILWFDWLAGILRRNRTCWISSTETGFWALSWSIRTDGLFAPRLEWSNHQAYDSPLVDASLYECSTIRCNSAYGPSVALGLSQSRPMVSTQLGECPVELGEVLGPADSVRGVDAAKP
jgi:hypothetical protein